MTQPQTIILEFRSQKIGELGRRVEVGEEKVGERKGDGEDKGGGEKKGSR